MTYVITINLNYENNDPRWCHELWDHITSSMLEAGFHLDGRNFSINKPAAEAEQLGRTVLAELEKMLSFEKKELWSVMKDCYGYDLDSVTNLLMPPADSIEVKTGISSED